MELEKLKEKEMPLLSRKRVTFMGTTEAVTPKRTAVTKEVAKIMKVKQDLVIIKHIYTRFGQRKFKVIAHIYSDEKAMKTLEHQKLIDKHQAKAGEKTEAAEPGEKPAEEKKEEPEEKPAEEKKE